MTDLQAAFLSIGCKSTLILGIVTVLAYIAGRYWAYSCMAWKRVGVVALLILPMAAWCLPPIEIPVLSPSPNSNRVRHDTTGSEKPIPPHAQIFPHEIDPLTLLSDVGFEALNVTPRIPATTASATPVIRRFSLKKILIAGLALAYGFFLSVLIVRFIGAWRGLQLLKRSSSVVADADWLESLGHWTRSLGVRRHVELRVSNSCSVPLTFGWRKPVILVPHDCLISSDRIERDAILIHELTHIKNGDFFWQVMTQCMATLYWIHPLAWFVRREAEILRERICDQFCSRSLGRDAYALALVRIAARSAHVPTIALGMAMAQRSSLRRRLHDINEFKTEPHSRSGRIRDALVVGMATCALGIIVVGMLTVRVPPPKSTRLAVEASNQPDMIEPNDAQNATELMRLPQTISGFVTDENGDALRDANVTLSIYRSNNPFDKIEWTAATDSDGSYKISVGDVTCRSADEINLQIQADGYYQQVSKFDPKQQPLDAWTTQRMQSPRKRKPIEWANWKDDTEEFNAAVAATVNGQPILNGAILDRYAGYLISVREQMLSMAGEPSKTPPGQPIPTRDDFDKFRRTLIQRDIASYIQKVALVQHMMSGLTQYQIVESNRHIDQLFEKQCDRLKQELHVATIEELERELKTKGSTLQKVKESFTLDRLSTECFVAKADSLTPTEAPEIAAYYDSHVDLFSIPKTVSWQEIALSISPELSDAEATKRLDDLLVEFNDSDPFERKKIDPRYSKYSYSRLPLASLKDAELESQLFSMPLNQWSKVSGKATTYSLVRVTAREEGSRKALAEVQDQIRQKLDVKKRQTCAEKFMREVFSTAKIETQYSLPKFYDEGPSGGSNEGSTNSSPIYRKD